MILFSDILPLAALLFAVSAPALVERFIFHKRIGIFQILFSIFALQCAAVALGIAIIELFGKETIVGIMGGFLGAVGFIAIGAIPLFFIPAAVVMALGWLSWKWIKTARS